VAEPLLSVRDLRKHFPVHSNRFLRREIGAVRAVDGISFDLRPGTTLGLVGESGCGKTTAARTILRALEPTGGEVRYRDARGETFDLATLDHRELKPLRRELQMIFQDPFASLNPRFTVERVVTEPLVIHGIGDRRERVVETLRRVGLGPEHLKRYPHEFSGGQRQRIGIARALILEPRLVICDEAVSALDVSVQAQVLNLLEDLQEEFELTYIFVAHDLSVVRHIADEVAVMYAGKIVEHATCDRLFADPKHPYPRALLASVPDPDPDRRMDPPLVGEPADPSNLPSGCAFHPRCPEALPACSERVPDLLAMADNRRTACLLYEEEVTSAVEV